MSLSRRDFITQFIGRKSVSLFKDFLTPIGKIQAATTTAEEAGFALGKKTGRRKLVNDVPDAGEPSK